MNVAHHQKGLRWALIWLLLASSPSLSTAQSNPPLSVSDVVSKRLDQELARIAKLAKGKVFVFGNYDHAEGRHALVYKTLD